MITVCRRAVVLYECARSANRFGHPNSQRARRALCQLADPIDLEAHVPQSPVEIATPEFGFQRIGLGFCCFESTKYELIIWIIYNMDNLMYIFDC